MFWDEFRTAYSAELNKVRNEAGAPMRQFAVAADLDATQLRQIERGNAFPRDPDLVARGYCDTAEVSLEVFWRNVAQTWVKAARLS